MATWERYIFPTAVTLIAPVAGYATQYLTIAEAQRVCYPSASLFEAAHVIFTPEQISTIEEKSDQKIYVKGQQVWRALDGGRFLGYFVVDYVIGKHLLIDYAACITPEKKVSKIEILQYRESYGGEIRNEDWLKQFVGKSASDPLELNRNVVNIGGATLSARHLTEGVSRVLAVVDTIFKEVKEPHAAP